MGPNVTRLFDDTKDGSSCAPVKLAELFAVHGEALITALEDIVETVDGGQYFPFKDALEHAKQLLAQLEREAQP